MQKPSRIKVALIAVALAAVSLAPVLVTNTPQAAALPGQNTVQNEVFRVVKAVYAGRDATEVPSLSGFSVDLSTATLNTATGRTVTLSRVHAPSSPQFRPG